MSIEIISIIILLAMFIIGSFLPINIGVLGFVAAFLVGALISGMSVDDIFAVFPADLFIILAGVTYLFAIVKNNGTIDLITSWGLRLVKGNTGLIPWVMFSLSFLLCSVGTQGTAAVIIIAPIALRLAAQCKINPIMMALMVALGMTGGIFSPLNLMGLVVNGVMDSRNLSHSQGLFFMNTFLFSFAVAFLIYVVFGGLRLLKMGRNNSQSYVAAAADADVEDETELPTESNIGQNERLTPYKGATLAGIGILIICAIWLDINMGFAALMVGLALALMAPKKQAEIMGSIPWSIIFMVSGIVTYVGVMESIGVMDYLTEQIANVKSPVLAALITSYIGGIISAFASTTGFLAAVIPLSVPILQDPSMSSVGVISAISIAASVVDISPFSTTGAVLLANAQGIKENVFYKRLLIIAGIFVAAGPGLAWLIFVVLF
ncbi:SLC13 family permease [Metabacillus arenae]|uniref:SLC13 family permease n=1 Tax=Metabacillus arenae TaxID=2771434 RepID=A0A926NHX4_9BACI|nr:SLC13 family permease [Metabacillus arenae]MBD1381984.1 SLC13 family permease [Metabacillus arenae]